MNQQEAVAIRLKARAEGRAQIVRSASSLAPDREGAIGIAPIKVVTEEVVQALAYGPLGAEPEVVARLNPMSRDVSDLEGFATWLVEYVNTCADRGEPPRVWLPHQGALESLDLLGRRYATNQEAPEIIRQMGLVCRILAEEARFGGQQVVAVALDLFKEHVLTGQMPTEDNHIGAMLAWLVPEPGQDPREVARERSRKAASGVLVNTPDQPDDDEVERHRRIWKKGASEERAQAASQIESVLTAAALREWGYLREAREAFWGLGLERPAHQDLVDASLERVGAQLEANNVFVPKYGRALALRLATLEHSNQLLSNELVETDSRYRKGEINRGRVVEGEIVHIHQPKAGKKPCRLRVSTGQKILRLRTDEKLRTVDRRVDAIVRDISRNPATGLRELDLEVERGVRAVSGDFYQGMGIQWVPKDSMNLYMTHKPLRDARKQGAWLVCGDEPPAPGPRTLPEGDPLELANGLIKGDDE